MVVFTKFDGQIIKEYTDLNYMKITDKWEMAKENAENAFQTVYVPKVTSTKYPPQACVKLEGRKWYIIGIEIINSLADMDMPDKDCSELTEKTADAITDTSMHQLFVSTQRNNLDLCVKSALR